LISIADATAGNIAAAKHEGSRKFVMEYFMRINLPTMAGTKR
jgi:hypothetical protein